MNERKWIPYIISTLMLMVVGMFIIPNIAKNNETQDTIISTTNGNVEIEETSDPTWHDTGTETFNYNDIPEYSGVPYIEINGNIPYFTEEEITLWSNEAFEFYAELDSFGRCGTCIANIGTELMPTDNRESISSIKPTGWVPQTISPAVYNRCHLIGFQLTGENANRQNLITGTRALNVDAMLPYENLVAEYIKETGNHVLYRVTPIFIDNEMVCRGLIMEGYSIEDNGKSILYCVWCYNSQDNITINYATGEYTYNDGTSKNHDKASAKPKYD